MGRPMSGRSELSSYRDMAVLITGHTGFKGSWLAAWLKMLGAGVAGFARPPERGADSLFEAAGIARGMDSRFGDIRDLPALIEAFEQARPSIVFHLAAQPLVRRSYAEPVETYATNVMGTVHVLEAARRVSGIKAVVVVTSDKCYAETEGAGGYGEDDPMGGADPYSSSKGCAELVSAAYRRSFFSSPGAPLIATVRSGNVIGGGDWGADRLVPDIARAIAAGQPVRVRNPVSVRPWQHVLEPLRGYLMVGARLAAGQADFADGWNFGPADGDAVSVESLAGKVAAAWGAGQLDVRTEPGAPAEAASLMLNIAKARGRLGYQPILGLDAAIELTVGWYKGFFADAAAAEDLTTGQIAAYLERLA